MIQLRLFTWVALSLFLAGCSHHPIPKPDLLANPPRATVSFDGQPITPKLILASIEMDGAPATLAGLWGKNETWDPMIAGIKSGDPQWMQVYLKLASSTENGSSEDFNQAIAGALETNPVEALAALKTVGFAAGANCATTEDQFNDISPEAKVHADTLKHIQKRLGKLAGLKGVDPETKGECIEQLNAARKEITSKKVTHHSEE